MQPIQTGIWSLLPPTIAIVFALITKEVILSLFLGLISGVTIYTFAAGFSLASLFKLLVTIISESLSANVLVIIFVSILGALSRVIIDAGGAQGYAEWAKQKIKSKKMSQITCFFLSILFSIDDYFSCLTVGTVMKPIMEQNRVSKSKFSYMVDSMAAPICIIMPISSWAATVVSCFESAEIGGMDMFIKCIPYNFYAIFTILTVLITIFIPKNLGSMAKFEKEIEKRISIKKQENISLKTRNRISDLLIPILTLVLISVILILETGGFFSGNRNLIQILGKSNSGLSIAIGAIAAILVSFFLTVPQKLKLEKFNSSICEGIKSMTPAFVVLTLAWSMTSVCRNFILTGDYISGTISSSNFPEKLLPFVVFVGSAILSFAIGSSWGAFGMLIPVAAAACQNAAPEMMVFTISAVLSGSIFGDHCSPISDSTILSSASTECNHIDHVSTQLPYAICVAITSCLAFLLVSFISNILSVYIFAIIFLAIISFFAEKFLK